MRSSRPGPPRRQALCAAHRTQTGAGGAGLLSPGRGPALRGELAAAQGTRAPGQILEVAGGQQATWAGSSLPRSSGAVAQGPPGTSTTPIRAVPEGAACPRAPSVPSRRGVPPAKGPPARDCADRMDDTTSVQIHVSLRARLLQAPGRLDAELQAALENRHMNALLPRLDSGQTRAITDEAHALTVEEIRERMPTWMEPPDVLLTTRHHSVALGRDRRQWQALPRPR